MTTTYISQITGQINAVTESCRQIFLYGENIDTGSRIAGLARGLKVNPSGKIQNVGNCELTHAGVGLGMMLDGGNAVLFMKQLDFLLLGLDQVVNTFNFVRSCGPVDSIGSFTIYPIVCDQGYQGPQSSLNAPGDFASLANVPVYCLNGAEDAAHVIRDQFVSPGFRIVCTSQRLFGAPALELPVEARSADNSIFKYLTGSDVTIVSYNFALRAAVEVANDLKASRIEADLFHVNFVPNMDLGMLMDSCAKTGKLIILDDSKTVTKFGDLLVSELLDREMRTRVRSFTRRGCSDEDYGVGEDRYQPDLAAIRSFLLPH